MLILKERLNGCNMLHNWDNIIQHCWPQYVVFVKHHVGTCWAVLHHVGKCWMKFDFCQTFHPTLTNIFLQACALVDIQSVRQSKLIVIQEGTAFV